MATKMKRLILYLRTFILLVWTPTAGGAGYNCPYGGDCAFEPAPPGRAPPCALPGLTYCVHPDPYPESVIRQLVEAGQYDIRTLLSDESRDDFNTRRDPYGYGPNSLPNVDQISLVNDVFPKNYNKFHNNFNHDIFGQKTPLQPPSAADPTPYNINAYQASNYSKYNGFQTFQHTAPANFWNPQPTIYMPQTGNYNAYQKKLFRETGNPNTPNNQNVYPSVFDPNSDSTDWFRAGTGTTHHKPKPDNYNAYQRKLLRETGNPNLGHNQNVNPSVFDPNSDTTDWFTAGSGTTQYNPNDWWRYISPSRSDVKVQRSITYPTRSYTNLRNATLLAGSRKKRNAELVRASRQRKLTGAEALKIALGLASSETSAERPRRQASGTQELCQVRTSFITPRAALNNRGSWKYVVNMPDNMTQLVKAEICTSTVCNGLCSVPLGYTTRCEQKYIQKRLVALEGNGQNLYTDVFWIPSCCQCTIVSTN